MSQGLTADEAAHTAVVTAVVSYRLRLYLFRLWPSEAGLLLLNVIYPKVNGQRCNAKTLHIPIQVDSPAVSLHIMKAREPNSIAV